MVKFNPTRPNKKQPRLRGPLVFISNPDIHGNPVRVRINIGTINFCMSSDRLEPNEFPIGDICDTQSLRDKTYGRVDLSCLNSKSRPRKRRIGKEKITPSAPIMPKTQSTNEDNQSKNIAVKIFLTVLGVAAFGIAGKVYYNHLKKIG